MRLARQPGTGPVDLPGDIWILPDIPVPVELSVQPEAQHIGDAEAAAENLGGRWQAVLKPQGPEIAQILDIPLGLGNRKQHSRPRGIQLAVGTHRDVVIIGHCEFEFDLCDLVLGAACAVDKGLVVEGVEEPDLFTAVGLQPSS